MSSLSDNRSRTGWWVLGVVLASIIAYVATSFIGVVMIGLFLYYSTRPIYARVHDRVSGGNTAAAIALFLLALPALSLVSYSGIVAYRELRQIAGVQLPKLDGELFGAVVNPEVIFQQEVGEYLSTDQLMAVLNALASAADTLTSIGVALIQAFVVVAIAFYLLRDGPRLADWFLSTFGDGNGVLAEFLGAADQSLESVFFGNILNALVTGAIGAILFSLLNIIAPEGASIPAAALTGLLTGVASLIPVVGMKLVYVPLTVYIGAQSVTTSGTESLWFVVLFFGVALVIVDTIPDLVLRPYVSGGNLHVGTLMLAYILGPLLFGWYGLFLMPVLLIFIIHFARIVLPELIAGERVRPQSFGTPEAVPTGAATGPRSPPRDASASAEAEPSHKTPPPESSSVSAESGRNSEPSQKEEDSSGEFSWATDSRDRPAESHPTKDEDTKSENGTTPGHESTDRPAGEGNPGRNLSTNAGQSDQHSDSNAEDTEESQPN